MNRPWKSWLVFGLCSAVLMAVMGWVSLNTLRLDRLQQEAAQRAELEERVRLALWRMDSWLAPIIVEESARPYSAYEPFPEARRAYTKGYTQLKQGDVLVPSPLLNHASSNILLHFQLHADGRVTSPQAPTGAQRELAEAGYASQDRIAKATLRLEALRRILDQPASAPTRASGSSSIARSEPAGVQTAVSGSNGDVLIRETATPSTNVPSAPPPTLFAQLNPPAPLPQSPAQMIEAQQFRNDAEWNMRANTFQQAQQRVAINNQMQQSDAVQAENQPPGQLAETEGVFKPVWLGDTLVLARRVTMGKDFVIQGCWLNWDSLRTSLLESVQDLFPAAALEPVPDVHLERDGRMLAALPVKLDPGPIRFDAVPSWTPLRTSLVVAWVCALIAGLAVAALLHGTLSLSERRAAFVSAVTHELRTPLTTFKMYSEMLAGGMVSDATKRQHYLDTLCSESSRLGHLVENVLAYARLERGNARSRIERLTLGGLIERVKPRLAQRAQQAGMTLMDDADDAARATVVHVDVAAVEQILFNLVDNACKYAAPTATDRIIHLEALPENGRFAMVRVRDHGQGISAEAARHLFEPFNKSAHQAARTAPGVGLGLALCRRLSRSMGGDLRWDSLVRGGACFVLALPTGRGSGLARNSANLG
jgi:signal transduction histidine kinase